MSLSQKESNQSWEKYEGMDEHAIENYEYQNGSDTLAMTVELKGGDTTMVGFCERQQDHNADTLRQFIVDHPEFALWIQPIIEDDPEWADGLVTFKRITHDQISVQCQSEAARLEDRYNYETTISFGQYEAFVKLVEPIACLMVDNGEHILNA